MPRVLDFAVAGDEAPRPVPAFMQERTERASNGREVVAQIVEYWRGAVDRTAPVMKIIRQGAALEAALLDPTRRLTPAAPL